MKRRSIGPSVSFFAFQDIITAVVGIFILIVLILVLELTERVEAASNPPAADVENILATIASLRSETKRLSLEYDRRIESQMDVVDVNSFNREAKTDELEAAIKTTGDQVKALRAQISATNEQIKHELETETRLLLESSALEGKRSQISQLKEEDDELGRTIDRLKSSSGLIYRNETSDGRSLCILTIDSLGIEIKDAASKQVRSFRGSIWDESFEQWLQKQNVRSRHFLVFIKPSGAEKFDAVRELLSKGKCVFGFDVVSATNQVQLSFEWEPN